MLVRTFASAVNGIDAVTVTIEVNVSRGVRFFLVGLPDVAVKESQQRIESDIRFQGFRWPAFGQLIYFIVLSVTTEIKFLPVWSRAACRR